MRYHYSHRFSANAIIPDGFQNITGDFSPRRALLVRVALRGVSPKNNTETLNFIESNEELLRVSKWLRVSRALHDGSMSRVPDARS